MDQFGFEPHHRTAIETIFKKSLLTNQKIRVWIFGSRVRGNHRPFSDVDLIIEATPPLTSTLLSQIAADFEESSLPFKFDLVPLDSIYPPYAPQIHNEKKLLVQLGDR